MQKKDNAERVPDMGERGKNGEKKRLGLHEITRFTMTKRIW